MSVDSREDAGIRLLNKQKGRRGDEPRIRTVHEERLRPEEQGAACQPHPTVFASNCNGGVMTHDLGLQFKSPTVNLFIRPKEYVKFLGNLRHYLYAAHF